MASSDKELEQQLLDAGNQLVEPFSSVDELLPLLDQVEHCLSRVEQSPTKAMQNALSPSVKALVADQLFRHSNADVKVAVASCISEITRITAPDAPYDDDQMKEVFQLIVSSFENLFDKSSRSYTKRTSILETVAKVRSCVVMLDLECDALIIEMFQHFLKAIRDYHPENVFSSMETIMTLVVEESEDISLELLSPILASVKKDNEEVLPVARKLGERVLETCASKLKPYLIQAVKSLGISLDDYSQVVASICQETSGATEENDVHAVEENDVLAVEENDVHAIKENDVHTANEHMVDESNAGGTSLDEAAQVDKETATEAASPEQVDPANDRSPKSAVSNGATQTGEDDSMADSNSLKKQEHTTDQSKSSVAPSNDEPDGLGCEKVVDTEPKPDQTTKKRGRKPNFSIKLTEPSDSSHIDGEKEAEKLPDNKTYSKDVPNSPREDQSVEAVVSSENEKETGNQPSSPKAVEGESINVASPSPSSLPDESRAKRAGRPKMKESLNKEASPSADDGSRKASEGTSDSEAKPQKRSGKKAPAGTSNEDKSVIVTDASKKESDTTSDSEAKPLKQSVKKVDASSNNGDGSSLKLTEKRRARGKAISAKDVTKTSTKDDDKEMISSPKSALKSTKDEPHSEETPKTNSKRKRTPGKENVSDIKDDDENLVGSKIKVWWPKDQTYYQGVVESYDSVKKKHRVLYVDGDEEILNLKRQKWEFIGADSGSDGEQAADQPSPDVSSEMPLKKKVKTNSDSSTKQVKMDISLKKGGGASSSKSKGAVTKSVRKSEDDSNSKSKDSSKTVSKSKSDNVGKSKDHTPKSGGKSVDVASKAASKSKNVDAERPKSSKSKEVDTGSAKSSTKSKQDASKAGKSKQETPKSSSNAKGKPTKSGGKSNANGTGKLKSGSSRVKESEDVKETPADSAKAPRSEAKGKSPSSSKAQGSEAKTGKKRRRGSKS